MITKCSKWKLALFCASCNSRVTQFEYAYSNGMYPHCGNINNSTYLKVDTKAYRVIMTRDNPRWMFWKRSIKTTEFKG